MIYLYFGVGLYVAYKSIGYWLNKCAVAAVRNIDNSEFFVACVAIVGTVFLWPLMFGVRGIAYCFNHAADRVRDANRSQ